MGEEEREISVKELMLKLNEISNENKEIKNILNELKKQSETNLIHSVKNDSVKNELYDISEVSSLLNMSKRSARRLFKTGQIKGSKDLSNRIKFKKADVYDYINKTLISEQYGIKGCE